MSNPSLAWQRWSRVQHQAIDETREAATAAASGGRLDEQPMVICRCGVGLYSHKIDTQRAPTDDGRCDGFIPAKVIWREVRQHSFDLAAGDRV